jgi:ligand-binding sensor domain-containing protein
MLLCRKYKLLTLLCLMACSKSQAQNHQLRADYLSVSDGLPKYETFSTSLDEKGYVWFSLRESISRYDGYNFKTYDKKHLRVRPDHACHLYADGKGRIWNWNLDGSQDAFNFNVLYPETGDCLPFDAVFENQAPFRSSQVKSIIPPARSDDPVSILTKSGSVYMYDGKFTHMSGLTCNVDQIQSPNAGATKAGYWLACQDTLYEFDQFGGLSESTKLEAGLADISLASNGNAIYLDRQGIDYSGNQIGLWIRKGNASFRKVLFKLPEKVTSRGNMIVLAGEDGQFWLVLAGMVCVLDENGTLLAWHWLLANAQKDYTPEVERGYLLNDNILFVNSPEGVFKVALADMPYRNFLAGRSCRGIFKLGNSLLVNSYQGNAVIDLKGGYIKQGIGCSPYGYGFSLDARQNLWIGNETDNLCYFNLQTRQTKAFSFSSLPQRLVPMLPFPLVAGKQVLLGTQRGLHRLETATGNIYHIKDDEAYPEFSKALIRHFFQNEEGIWIGTNVGLFLLSSNAKIIRKVAVKEGLANIQINFIYEDKEGVFWLATRESGLIRWDRGNNSTKLFSTENGLSNNNIHCIYEDRKGQLWMSSNYGLMCFDKATLSVNTFLTRDGLPHNEFNFASHFMDESGKLYFGGLNGVTSFHPEELQKIEDKHTSFNLVITGFSVLNAETGVWNDRSVEISQSGKIVLEPNEKYADLQFSLLDFQDPMATRYAWKIDGFLGDWIYQYENSIKLSQLPVGNYTLRLRAQGSNGQWSDAELSLPLEIVAPIYYKSWFYLALAAAITGLIYLFMRWKNDRLEREMLLLEKEV